MCIICNCDKDENNAWGSKFLNDFGQAQFHLKNAEKAMLECSKIDKKYNPKHKQLVRLRKELNKWFTEEREKHEPSVGKS